MARTRPKLDDVQAAWAQEIVSNLLNASRLAEEAVSVTDVLDALVGRMAGLLDSRAAFAILAAVPADSVGHIAAAEPDLITLRAELDREDVRIIHAVEGRDGAVRPIALKDVRRALASVEPERCCIAWDVAGDQVARIILEIPGVRQDVRERLQATLQCVANAVLDRHRSAVLQRRRLERVATLSTILADIASDLDIDLLLTNIVEQARALIGTDSAYLAEVDERTGTVAMRVTVGITDAGYKQGTVEIGKGMAGAVAAKGAVMSTRDYLADNRFVHTLDTDANVSREGIRGVIMAPMQARDRVTGVLGVANHHATDFAEDDLRLAQSLADGAAIAMENARLYAEQTKLVEQLRTLNELTTEQNERLRRSMLIHEQLAEIVLQGHGIEVIAHRLAALFLNPIIVLNQFFAVLAASGLEDTDAAAIAARIESLDHAPRPPSPRDARTPRLQPARLCHRTIPGVETPIVLAAVKAGHDLLGHVVVLESQQSIDELDFQALEQSLTVVALEFTRSRVAFEVENRLRGNLVHDLVLGTIDSETIIGRAARLGHDLTLPQTIIAISIDMPPGAIEGVSEGEKLDRSRRLEGDLQTRFRRRSIMAQTSLMGDVVVALVAAPPRRGQMREDSADLTKQVEAELVACLAPWTASMGVSRSDHDAFSLARAYQEAMLALRIGQQAGQRGARTVFGRLGIDRFLFELPHPAEIDDYVQLMLGPLLTYDARHGTEFLATLAAYIEAGGRQRETARALGVHVNTLQYRLRRIEDLARVNLGDAEVRLNLHLALRARRMRLATGIVPPP